MIDLKSLEKEIDLLLQNETESSLTNWLLQKRNKELSVILGSGTFISLQGGNVTFSSTGNINVSASGSVNMSEKINFLTAA